MARRVNELCNWQIELYIDAVQMDTLYKLFVSMPAISIDQLGISEVGFPALLKLVEKRAYVKASGFGQVGFDVINAMKQIYSINPGALVFATDLPSTRAPRAYSDNDFNLIVESFSTSEDENIFYNNAIAFYKIKDTN